MDAEDLRCTEAVLVAFGVRGVRPRFGTGVMTALLDAGYVLRPFGTSVPVDAMHEEVSWFGKTLRAFVRAHPRGDYYVSTRGHAMALRGGVLTDTQGCGPDGRRVVGVEEVLPGGKRSRSPSVVVPGRRPPRARTATRSGAGGARVARGSVRRPGGLDLRPYLVLEVACEQGGVVTSGKGRPAHTLQALAGKGFLSTEDGTLFYLTPRGADLVREFGGAYVEGSRAYASFFGTR